MVYVLKQTNSESKNLSDLESILEVTSDVFLPEIGDPEIFAKSELFNFQTSEVPWQLFYIMEGDNVAGSLCLVIREGNCPGKKDICITLVNTNPNYRRKGLMEVLFNYIFRVYEKRESFVDTLGYEVGENTGDECMEFLNKLEINDGYWVLYSIVETYYAKYGFHAFKSLNYFKEAPKNLVFKEDFQLSNGEQYITLENLESFVHNEKYIPYPIVSEDINERSCGFKTSTIPLFAKRLEELLRCNGKSLESIGLHIADSYGESFIVINQHFGSFETMIQRLYTSVEDEDVLLKHLDRLYMYISHYLKTNYYSLDDNETENQWQCVWFSDNDIFATTNSAKEVVFEYFNKTKHWDFDESNAEHLAMLREWNGKPVDGLKWTYNGFWSLT